MGKRKTHEEFIKELNNVNSNITVLSDYINAKTKIKIKCKICNHEWESKPNDLLNGHGCPVCSNHYSPTQLEFENMVKDIHGNTYKVIGLYKGSKTKVKIHHTICNCDFDVTPNNFISKKSKCPICSNHKVMMGVNDMWTTNPELARLLANPEDGYKYMQNSNNKLDWKCPQCGSIIAGISVDKVNRYGLSCKMCGDGISYPNKLMYNILQNLSLNFDSEVKFDWCKFNYNSKIKTGIYDFVIYLDNISLIVEMDGGFHTKDNGMSRRKKDESKFIDSEKDRLAMKNGYKIIRIDATVSDLKFIKNNVLNSELVKYINFSNVDWDKCHKYSLNSKIIEACEIWNSGIKSAKEISYLMHMNKNTISKYLNKGAKIKLCDYNPELERKLHKNPSTKKVVCITTNEIFNSMIEASIKYNIKNQCNITACCKGFYKTAGKHPITNKKLKWMYYDEYLESTQSDKKLSA